MEQTAEDILKKLNVTQLKDLISLYGLEKPHSKSTKGDYITYIQGSNISLDARMLVNYFDLQIKTKKAAPEQTGSPSKVRAKSRSRADKVDSRDLDIVDDLSNVSLREVTPEKTSTRGRAKTPPNAPEKKRRSSKHR